MDTQLIKVTSFINILRMIVCFFCFFQISGCLYLPPVTEQVRIERINKLQLFENTRSDVLDLLGEPNIFKGENVYVYEYDSHKGYLLIGGFGGAAVSGAITEIGNEVFRGLFEFDSNDKIIRIEADVVPPEDKSKISYLLDKSNYLPSKGYLLTLPDFSSREHYRDECVSLAISPNGNLFAATDFVNQLWLWKHHSLINRVSINNLIGTNEYFPSLEFSPKGNYLALGGPGGTFNLWKVENEKDDSFSKVNIDNDLSRLKGVYALAFSPSGDKIAVGGQNGDLELRDLKTWRAEKNYKISNAEVQSISFSPDGSLVATGSSNGEVRILDLASGLEVGQIHGTESMQHGRKVSFSPDGNLLATNSCFHIEIWSLDNQKSPKKAPLKNQENILNAPLKVFLLPYGNDFSVRSCNPALSFSPDGSFLAAISNWSLVTVLDIKQNIKIAEYGNNIDTIRGMRFSPDGKFIVTTGTNGVRIWPAPTSNNSDKEETFEKNGVKIIVLREKQFCGSALIHNVLVDGGVIAKLKVGQHTKFNLSPGKHNIQIVLEHPLTYTTSEGIIIDENFRDGETYKLLSSSNCIEHGSIEKVDSWPDGTTFSPDKFVEPIK